MKMQPGDLLKWRDEEKGTKGLIAKYALVLEVDICNNTVVCEFYPSGFIQGNSCSSIQMWYEKVEQ